MSYFQSKTTAKPMTGDQPEPRIEAMTPAASKPAADVVSTIGPGMLITGNVVCTGALQISGRLVGDVHAARLVICEGAHVEGKIVAQEAVIYGAFKGTIHGNNVKLQATAVVDGEIYNKSLAIEQSAQFEGIARRLDRAVDAPVDAQVKAAVKAEAPALAPAAAPEAIATAPAQPHANGAERPSWVS